MTTLMFGCSLVWISFEGFFGHIASPDKWGKAGVEFLTLTGLKMSGKTTNMMILITSSSICRTEVLLPCKVGEEGLETYPCFPEFLWDGSEEKHCLSDPISISSPTDSSFTFGRGHSG